MKVITLEIWQDNHLSRQWKTRHDAELEKAREIYEMVEYGEVIEYGELSPRDERLFKLWDKHLQFADDAALEAQIDARNAMEEFDDWGAVEVRDTDCRTCGGGGMIDDSCLCEECDGTGRDLLYW